MQKILNKKLAIVVSTEGVDKILECDYAKLIKDSINRSERDQYGIGIGYSNEEVVAILRVEKAIKERKEEEMCFEDADFKFIKDKVARMRWGVVSSEIKAFVDEIQAIKVD